MRILGIDPGLDITGYGVIGVKQDKISVIEAGIIRTHSTKPLQQRIGLIYSQIGCLIKETSPDVCVVEQLYSHYKHPMTAILMAHARGAILLACSMNNVNVINYPAKTVKRSVTGNGNASKLQVQRVVHSLLNIKDNKGPADVTDALALCLTHIRHKSNALN